MDEMKIGKNYKMIISNRVRANREHAIFTTQNYIQNLIQSNIQHVRSNLPEKRQICGHILVTKIAFP